MNRSIQDAAQIFKITFHQKTIQNKLSDIAKYEMYQKQTIFKLIVLLWQFLVLVVLFTFFVFSWGQHLFFFCTFSTLRARRSSNICHAEKEIWESLKNNKEMLWIYCYGTGKCLINQAWCLNLNGKCDYCVRNWERCLLMLMLDSV